MAETYPSETSSYRTSSVSASDDDSLHLKKKIEGRSFNMLSDTYYLPSDEDEWIRLDQQHIAIKLGLDALYPAPEIVQAVLAPQPDVTRRILDLGYGTGVWTIEMAKEFPHAEVVGIDLAPAPALVELIPHNCHFEIEDINSGLIRFRNQFDLIHARLIGGGICNARKTIQDVNACLKPGGLVLWIDCDYDFCTGPQYKYLPMASDKDPSGSWLQRILYETRRAAKISGKSDIDGIAEALDEGLWDDPLIDPITCKTGSLYLPVGPWAIGSDLHETQRWRYIGSLLRRDISSAHRAMHPVLRRVNWPQETLDEWSRLIDEELMQNKNFVWGRMMLSWGRRRVAPGKPAPSLPASTLAPRGLEDNDDRIKTPYPHFYIYHTQEQARQEAGLRKKLKKIELPAGAPLSN